MTISGSASFCSPPRSGGFPGLSSTTRTRTSCTIKGALADAGIKMDNFAPALSWSDLKPNEQGLIPVIVQDYRTDEVLMLAYMNEEAFDTTIRIGKMTYYSRSRQCLWVKGETSGHFQYVHSLTIDCDKDTLLAKVDQVGPPATPAIRPAFSSPW